MTRKYDFVIVGAGLFGIVVAESLSSAGKRILLIDKRNHVGGNCYDYVDEETNIIVHRYGPHIFHINNLNILKYVSKFTEFNEYKHIVFSVYKDKVYHFPINLHTINSFYNINLKPSEVTMFIENEAKKCNIKQPKNLEEKVLSLIGEPLYKAFFKEYTIKQWGKNPTELPESIINRIPIKNNYDTGYYKKYFNGIPKHGYTSMFEQMLLNKSINIELGVDFFEDRDIFLRKSHVVYTGEIDRFFNYQYGHLEYRGLHFIREIHDIQDFQGNSVINYPELSYNYTRICEPRHFYPERWKTYIARKTLSFKEIPLSAGSCEHYYPIRDLPNLSILDSYLNDAKEIANVSFGGRLGEYMYYDMEDTIISAQRCARTLLLLP